MNELTVVSTQAALIPAVAACLALRGQSVSRAVVEAHLGAQANGDELLRGLAELGVEAQWAPSAAITDDILPAVACLVDGPAVVVARRGEDHLTFVTSEGALVDWADVERWLAFAQPRVLDPRASDLVPETAVTRAQPLNVAACKCGGLHRPL